MRVVLLAKGEVARDDLIEGKYSELDVVAVLIIAIDVPPMVLVALPAKLGAQVKVKDLELVGLRVDQEIP